tara:strand:- start:108 stop:362 length:255 start_codon:yes stop_codon:yes gene_type:complete
MEFNSKLNKDGGFTITIEMSAEDVDNLNNNNIEWGKTDYCVTCRGNDEKYTIQTYGDIAANIEAAATCLARTGNPSYGLDKGRC